MADLDPNDLAFEKGLEVMRFAPTLGPLDG